MGAGERVSPATEAWELACGSPAATLKAGRGAGEMAQELRILDVPPEDWDPVATIECGIHPHSMSKLFVTLLPGDATPSSGFHWHEVCTRCTDIHVGKSPIDMK